MKLHAKDLDQISSLTLAHYNQRAGTLRKGTCVHGVSQNIAALLGRIEAEPPFTILDFGCGPGRDLKAFAALGHIALGAPTHDRPAAIAPADSRPAGGR